MYMAGERRSKEPANQVLMVLARRDEKEAIRNKSKSAQPNIFLDCCRVAPEMNKAGDVSQIQ